jgi:hypothetical protein
VSRIRPIEVLELAVIALFFLAAPTAGDIGCFTQPADALDPAKFFDDKQNVDCKKCTTCRIETMACTRACGPTVNPGFPQGCFPVVHDGEVCLDALEIASCADYAGYEADQSATIPTECDFCPPLTADGGIP